MATATLEARLAVAARRTTMTPLPPLRFEPILKRLIWGGRRLGKVLGKPIGPGDDYAESWEVADHEHGRSVVVEGPLRGVSLHQLTADRPADLLGPDLAGLRQFPLLVKFIDAHQALSVQVHPDDDQGRRLANDNGKTEAWVVLAAEPGSLIYAGLRPGVGRDRFAGAIRAGEVEPLLHRFEPAPGDCIFLPAGTVHAIGAGVLLAEVQQMSDATFRVDDWGRLGADGRPRKLHVEEALQVIDFDRGPVDPVRPAVRPESWGVAERLVDGPYFRLDRLRLEAGTTVGSSRRFTILIGVDGSADVGGGDGPTPLRSGETLLLPASLGSVGIEPGPDGATVLTCTVP